MYRAAIFLSLILAAASPQAADLVPTRTVALIPAAEPLEYKVASRSSVQFLIPLVATATHAESKKNTKLFSDLMRSKGFKHGSFVTEKIAEGLRASGYQVIVLSSIAREADDPDSIDYEKFIFEGDIALHIRFDEIGFYSGFGSTSYVPKVNLDATSFTKGEKLTPYETTLNYGKDAKPGKDDSIVSPETFNFATFEAIFADPDAVNAIYEEALTKIAERVVSQFKATSPLRPAPPQ